MLSASWKKIRRGGPTGQAGPLKCADTNFVRAKLPQPRALTFHDFSLLAQAVIVVAVALSMHETTNCSPL